MDVGAAFVADEQALEVVQPSEGALDDPAVAAETGAVLGRAPSDHRPDPALPELAAMASGVVGAIGDELPGPATRPTDEAAHVRHAVDEREQLGDVVAVAAREREGERDARLVDDQMMFGAEPSTVNRARARRTAPFFACT